MLAVDLFLVDPATAPASYDRLVGERFDGFLRTGRRFSFLIGHPWLLRTGLRRRGRHRRPPPTSPSPVMGNLVDNETPGAAGRVLRVADTLARARRSAAPQDPRLGLTRRARLPAWPERA